MTFMFLLLFGLVMTALDSARFFASAGYVKTAAHAAQISIYGNYNRELYLEYSLLGYGGYAGKGIADWKNEYEQIVLENLRERPQKSSQSNFGFAKKYASVYQMGAIQVSDVQEKYLCQNQEFYEQIEQWIKTVAVQNFTDNMKQKIRGMDGTEQEKMAQQTERLEKAKEEHETMQDAAETGDTKTEAAENMAKDETNGDSSTEKAVEKENPIEFVKDLMRDGILSLVCNEKKLSEKVVDEREACIATEDETEGKGHEEKGDENSKEKDWNQASSGLSMLKNLFQEPEVINQETIFHAEKRKIELLLYDMEMFDCYTVAQKRNITYGLEYLITGKRNEKDAFSAIVNRLLLIRTISNYIYVSQDAIFQEESLLTATAITATFAGEAFIPLVQNAILMVVALEEACVDVTALLDGRGVPLLKNASNFKMTYPEICMANRELFVQKGKMYPKIKGDSMTFSKGISYKQYLWMFAMMTSKSHLKERTLDLIQSDLREKYNQSFEIGSCISGTKVEMVYGLPMFSPFYAAYGNRKGNGQKNANQEIYQKVSVCYGY